MKINRCLNATLILILSTAWPSFAQVALEDSSFAPDANKPVESLAAGDWGMGTNTLSTPEALAARIAVAAGLAVATNAGPSISKAPRVQSASSGSPPAPARWVAGADGHFTTENTSFQAMLAGTLNVEGALTVAIPDAEPGTYLRGTILLLAYCEPGELGRSVTIATSKPVQGQLLDQTRVIFKGAFAGEGTWLSWRTSYTS